MFRSEYAEVPAVEVPIHEAVLGRAAEWAEAPALVDGVDGTSLTYGQLEFFHRRLAAGLALSPGTEMRIVSLDDPGRDLGVGEAGEIVIRGPQVMKGYLGRPDATAAMIDAEGWLRTGDVGRVDADGWLFVVDRVKELIKYKGFQVAPAELEALLLTHPGIADAAVVGAYDEERNEVPHAFVVRQPSAAELSEGEVMMFVAERVAPYKRVRRVTFVEGVPRAASGKILRRELRGRS